ncbi:MAG: hypothetical protein ACYTGQ_03760 [Planctomycetota bacterium]|jgi:hypothetical protein
MIKTFFSSASAVVVLWFAGFATAQNQPLAAPTLLAPTTGLALGAGEMADGYTGGRGLITMEGVSGMFMNPTSGTLPEGVFTAQYCVAILDQNGDEEFQHTSMLTYGLSDWLEVGGFFRVSDLDNATHNIGGGGPLVRARLLKEEDGTPEVSVGWLSRMGYENLTKHTLFVAASKRFAIDEDGPVKAFRLHGGLRQIWQDSDVNEANGSVGYIGGELELPMDLHFVAEVSTKDDVFNHTPFAFGLQWRPAPNLGFSFAGVQTGGEDSISPYVGIGITFGN